MFSQRLYGLILVVFMLSLFGWSPDVTAKKWHKTEEYAALKDQVERICPMDGSLKKKIAEPYPEEPAELIATMKPGKGVSSLQSQIKQLEGLCTQPRGLVKQLADTKFDKKKIRWSSYAPFKTLIVTQGFYKAKYGTNVEKMYLDAKSKCGNGKQPSLKYGDRDLATYNNFLAGLWVARRVNLRFRDHFVENMTLPAVVDHVHSQTGTIGEVFKPLRWKDEENFTKLVYDHFIEKCSADIAIFETKLGVVKETAAKKDADRQYRRVVSPVIRGCGTDDPDPKKEQSYKFERLIKACKKATPEWQVSAQKFAQDEKKKSTLDGFIEGLEARMVILEAGLKKAQGNEQRCEKLAGSAYTRSYSLGWKKCMSNADLASTARRYAITDRDLYDDHMRKKAIACASAVGFATRAQSFYKGCVYVRRYSASLSSWYRGDDDVPGFCYDTVSLKTRNDTICVEEILEEKYVPKQ